MILSMSTRNYHAHKHSRSTLTMYEWSMVSYVYIDSAVPHTCICTYADKLLARNEGSTLLLTSYNGQGVGSSILVERYGNYL